jgi:hypothetical protein
MCAKLARSEILSAAARQQDGPVRDGYLCAGPSIATKNFGSFQTLFRGAGGLTKSGKTRNPSLSRQCKKYWSPDEAGKGLKDGENVNCAIFHKRRRRQFRKKSA